VSFFDDLGENISNIAKDVGEKAKELSGTAKIHANIKAEEVKIQELYYKLGRKYYELYQLTSDEGVKDIVSKIDACNKKIREFKEDLNETNEDQGAV
jgi:hypothetical protein